MLTDFIGRKYTGHLHTSIYMVCVVLSVMWIPQHTLSEFLLWFLFTYLLAGYLISGFQHRYCSHKSWQPSRPVEVLSALLVVFGLLTPSMGWSQTHINHHRYADTEKDPHGNFHSIWRNMLVFSTPFRITKIPRWMLRDKLYQVQAKFYWEIAVSFAVLMFILDLEQAYISFIAFIYLWQVSLNVLGHPNLRPTNNELIAWFWVGELYHKNHHDNSRNPRFGKFDTTYQFFIRWLNTKK